MQFQHFSCNDGLINKKHNKLTPERLFLAYVNKRAQNLISKIKTVIKIVIRIVTIITCPIIVTFYEEIRKKVIDKSIIWLYNIKIKMKGECSHT